MAITFTELAIPGAYVIDFDHFEDERGVVRRHFSALDFAGHKLASAVVQANVSENPTKGTLRGFHIQAKPYGEAKTLSCLTGSIWDIVVDLREDSPTHMQWASINLDAQNRKSLHVPVGCANAFLTLTDNVLVQYYCSAPYKPSAERSVRWNDPAFGFKWPFEPKLISAKDRALPDWKP